ncbi:hypothetical protein C8J56DRAFT_440114 [Mycena floridula]|nr:hypothetical protein C8J56DRAFT_440114 [Mycena floridula]
MLSTLISITLFSTALAAISLSVTPATDNVLVNTLIDCQWTASSSDPDTFNIVMEWDPSFLEQALVTTVHRGAATSGTVSNIPNVHILGIHRVAAFSDPYVTTSQPLALSDTFEVVDTLPESSTAVATSAPHTTSTTTTSTPTTADSTPTSVRDSNGRFVFP